MTADVGFSEPPRCKGLSNTKTPSSEVLLLTSQYPRLEVFVVPRHPSTDVFITSERFQALKLDSHHDVLD